MKSKVLSGIIVFAVLTCIAASSKACSTPPEAIIDGTKPKCQSIDVMPVPFSGGDSKDEDGWITDWDWDFDYNGEFQCDKSGVSVLHTYSATGVYTLRLRVTDNDGLHGFDSCTVFVTKVDLDISGVSDGAKQTPADTSL